MNNLFSIVGIGRHAKKKIIPFINKSKNKIDFLFSSKKHDYRTLHDLKKNINLVSKKNIFYISSPPQFHFEQAKTILNNDFNILCEKPALLSLKDFLNLKKIILKKKVFFIEVIIFKYSLLYKNFLKIWNSKKKYITKIEINFLIPRFTNYGFRKKKYNWSQCLYDIGIYPISLINLLNIKDCKIKIKKIERKKNLVIKKIFFEVKNKNYQIDVKIGESSNYINNIILHCHNKKEICFDYFFNGLKKNKKIHINKKKIIIKDHNCFEYIFSLRKKFWYSNRIKELNNIYKNIIFLKKIENKILRYKSN